MMAADDGFDSIVADLDLDTDSGLPASVADLDDLALVRRNERVRQTLIGLGELTVENPSTDEARALHSERVALLVEMRRRNLQ